MGRHEREKKPRVCRNTLVPTASLHILRRCSVRIEKPKVSVADLSSLGRCSRLILDDLHRVIESVFEKLVTWAAAALETSSNQPVLPHVVIVLNASENNIDPDLWNVPSATKRLLESLSQTVSHNATFKMYARFWRERNRNIKTVEELLLSYYSSVRVVRIPTTGRPNLINEQVQKLYTGIHNACTSSQQNRSALRMLLDAEELQPYLQYAFDHFACSLDTPFDFVQASLTNSPIPLDFGGNILKLAINLMESLENRIDGPTLFAELSTMVASCIMLDSARHKIRGTGNKDARLPPSCLH